MEKYDVIIIGAGPGGLAAAYALAPSRRVLVVERDLWGGTCPNYGCDPKKMLYSAVQAKAYARRMTHAGLVGEPTIDWPHLMTFKQRYTDAVPSNTLGGLVQAGITAVHGEAKFIDPVTIEVGDAVYRGQKLIVATGLQPATGNVVGHQLLGTSRDFLAMRQLPQTLAFIGAGYVSLELANIAAAAGATVHIINRSDRALRAFPAPAVAALRRNMQAAGVRFHDNVTLQEVRTTNTGLVLRGTDFELRVARAFAAVGRVPDVALHLSRADIATTAAGITVDDHLRTSNPDVYAIGDIVAKSAPKLTPVAGFEGRYVAGQLLGDTAAIDYPAQPVVVYGATEMAKVGVSIETAEAAPDRYVVHTHDAAGWYTYNRIQATTAQLTLITARATDTLAGAVVLADTAEELINLATLLINQHATMATVKQTIFAYPSAASDLQYLG
ncbi:dihydrolipoyl dehydrogenase family protein [Lacticaseibacillus daqingensis]|uniref:dihydrolipoyl dehydrogenase family protein n=1 Tax=Lacticaseibacillus daqingensis TaxID=2486014 RepID=UPI000F78374C|nr:NAD(P)/FAD-dependent oxidoreductase [Lacticaseibacillus daqingensis]